MCSTHFPALSKSLQKELQRNQAKIYKMYESIEDQRDNGSLTREQIVTLYRDNLAKSIVLFKQNRWAQHLQLLSEQRSKDIPSFTIKEREQLAEALEHCFINVKTSAKKYSHKSGSASVNGYIKVADADS